MWITVSKLTSAEPTAVDQGIHRVALDELGVKVRISGGKRDDVVIWVVLMSAAQSDSVFEGAIDIILR